MEDPIAVLRHNILGQLTVIKNALLFVLEGHAGEISEDTRKYLSEAYKRNEEVINTVIATRKGKQHTKVIEVALASAFGWLKRNEEVINTLIATRNSS